MKKALALICSAAVALSFAGCGSKTETTSTDLSEITGQVTEIDGTEITLQLGELNENSQSSQPPADKPSGSESQPSDSQAPPEKPNNGNSDNTQTPHEKPNGENNSDNQTPPNMLNNNSEKPSDNGNTPSDMPQNMPPKAGNAFTPSNDTITVDAENAEITIETGSETTDGTIDDIKENDILTLQIDENNSAKEITVKSASLGNPMGFGGSDTVTQGTSANTINSDNSVSGITYSSAGNDENALRIDNATVTLDNVTVDKNSGTSSNTEDGDFYGQNAALLATNGAELTVKNSVVKSSAQNGNGIFSYGKGTVVNAYDTEITTTADNSGGIQTTGGGTTNAYNLTVNTSGNSSAAIRSDRGGGTVNIDGGNYTSNGYNSPAVYSTADITVKNSDLTANNSEALVIEGKNSIALENCNVIGNMSDTEGSSSDENVHNVMIYQSMSGDAEVGTASFSMKGGSLTSNNGDMIYVTNTHSVINLSGVDIKNNDSDSYLLYVCGNSASRGWGQAGSNGADVEFTADGQTLNGNIAVDTISTLNLSLTNNSVFTGTINIVDNKQNGTATDNNAVITIESGSVFNLTGNCTITSIENNGTINFNGYTITLADGTVLSK